MAVASVLSFLALLGIWFSQSPVLQAGARPSPVEAQTAAWEVVGQIGGPTEAVAVQGSYAYVGVGLRLLVLDVSNPASLREVGATRPFPHFVEGVAVSGTLAYVAAGGSGLRVVDVSTPASPLEIGAWDSPGYAEGLEVLGTTVYLADGPYGLRVVDVSNPARPTQVGSAYSINYAFDVAMAGQYAYVAAAGAGLLVADVSDPANLREIASLDTPGYAYGVALSGTMAYVADGWEGLRLVDVADPSNPVEVGSYKTPGWAFGVAVSGTLAYVADAFKGLRVVDISNPAGPVEVGSYEVSGGHAGRAVLAGDIVYVADRNWGLRAVDVSLPSRPVQVEFYSPLGYADAVAIAGNYAYVAAATYGLRIVDISDPARPAQAGVYNTPTYATSVAAAGQYAYVATSSPGSSGNGLYVVDVSDPAHPTGVGFTPTGFGAYRDMAVAGGIAYLANEFGLELVSVSDPFRPTLLGFIRLWSWVGGPDATVGVAVSGTLAYLASERAGLRIVDVSNPISPTLLGAYQSESSFSQDVAVIGSRAYLADGPNGLRVVDVSNPANPIGMGSYDTVGMAYGVSVSGTLAYVADGSMGVSAVNVSDPLSPTLAGLFNTSGFAHEVVVAGNRVYVADGSNGVLILEPAIGGGVSGRGGAGTGSAATYRAQTAPEGLREGELHRAPRSGSRATDHVYGPTPGAAGGPAQVFSACVVTATADSGAGTLRWCMENVAGGAAITFNASVFPPASPATITLATALPAIAQGNITIDGSDAGVVLDGSGLSDYSNGLLIPSDGNTVRGLEILGFPNHGLFISGKNNVIGGDRTRGQGPAGQGNVISDIRGDSGIAIRGSGATSNTVAGNLIGTDASGTKVLGNAGHGVFLLDGASKNIIGGTESGERNIVSGNGVGGGNGVSMLGAKTNGNVIVGNYVGTDSGGTIDLGNKGHGIAMEGGAFNNLVWRNLSSGNVRAGVLISDWGSDYNVVVGNLVGTDASGARAIANDQFGVFVGFMGGSFNRIGGIIPEDKNVVSGNGIGVWVGGPAAVGNLVLGNFIGEDITAMQALGNVHEGVALGEAASRALIGGATAGERNIISGNGVHGVTVGGDYNLVQGNYIGTDRSGASALGNRGSGVRISAEHTVVQGNLIAHNMANGVHVDLYHYNTLRRNSIRDHSGPGIALINGGNNMLPAPVITAVTNSGVSGTACAGCTVEVFSDAEDEGRVYEGSAVAGPSGVFTFDKGGPLTGPNVTATATDKDGNTSEFSAPQKVWRRVYLPAVTKGR